MPYDKELYAILKGIEAYKQYLSYNKFIIYTDHKALKWIKDKKPIGIKLQRWITDIQQFDFDIEHRPGKSNVVADALSRRTYPEVKHKDSEEGIEPPEIIPSVKTISQDVNNSRTDQPETEIISAQEEVIGTSQPIRTEATFFYNDEDVNISAIEAVTRQPNPVECIIDSRDIGKLQRDCPDFEDIYKFHSSKEQTLPEDKKEAAKVVIKAQQYTLLNNKLYHWYQRRCQRKVPKDERTIQQLALPKLLRKDVLLSFHDNASTGSHFATKRVYEAIKQRYYWPGMHQDIEDYVAACDRCQRIKINRHARPPPLGSIPEAEVFDRWHMDILGPITESQDKYKYILVIVDSASRWPEAFPLRTQEGKEIANVLYNHIFTKFGCPRVLISDRGQNFLSKVVSGLCELFGVRRHMTSSYHAQTNSTVERLNSTIAQSLRAYIDKQQNNWPDKLPGILMAYRNSPCTQSTGFSPFKMLFGQEMRMPLDVALIPRDTLPKQDKEYLQNKTDQLKEIREIGKQNATTAKEKSKVHHDKKAKVPEFRRGDKILLRNHKCPKGHSPKLCDKFEGPYIIDETLPNFAFKLRRFDNNKLMKPTYNASNMVQYQEPGQRRLEQIPELEEEDSDEEEEPMPTQETVDEEEQPMTTQEAVEEEENQEDPPDEQDEQNEENDDEYIDDNIEDQPQIQDDTLYPIEQIMKKKVDKFGQDYYLVKWKDYAQRT